MEDWEKIQATYNVLFGYYPEVTTWEGPGGVNFMTPEILGRFQLGARQIEVSYGTGFYHDYIFGCTVVPDRDLSDCYESLQAMRDFINDLQNGEYDD